MGKTASPEVVGSDYHLIHDLELTHSLAQAVVAGDIDPLEGHRLLAAEIPIVRSLDNKPASVPPTETKSE